MWTARARPAREHDADRPCSEVRFNLHDATVPDLSYWQVLRDRRLALLLAGDAVSKVGDGMLVVALPLEALRVRAGLNPAIAISLIATAPYVLAVVVSLLFGFGHRRYRPRQVLLIDCTLRLAVFALVGGLAIADALPLWVLGLALFAGSGLQLLAASSRRLVATGMVDADGRLAVNGLLGVNVTVAAYVAGPVFGGLLASTAGPGVVLCLDAASFAGMLVLVVAAIPPDREVGASERRDSSAESGWTVLRRVPVAAWLFAVVFLVDLFYMPVDVALPLLVRGPLHASAAALGAIWTGFGIGAVLGAVAVNYLRGLPHLRLLIAIIAGWAGCVIALSLAPTVQIAVAAFAVGGLIWAPFGPIAYNLVQSALAPHEQQPVLTIWAAGVTIAEPVGLVLGGPLVQATGIRGGLATSAILTLLLVPLAARSRRRSRTGDLGAVSP